MKLTINIAFYNKKDWNHFLESIDDKDDMHDSWEEWYHEYQHIKNGLILLGFYVNDIVVDIDELINYCTKSGIKNDGKARSQFVLNREIN